MEIRCPCACVRAQSERGRAYQIRLQHPRGSLLVHSGPALRLDLLCLCLLCCLDLGKILLNPLQLGENDVVLSVLPLQF